jgi:hypothetical protein
MVFHIFAVREQNLYNQMCCILLTCGKHIHNSIILLRGGWLSFGTIKLVLPRIFFNLSACTNPGKWVVISVCYGYRFSPFQDFLFDFGTFLHCGIFCFSFINMGGEVCVGNPFLEQLASLMCRQHRLWCLDTIRILGVIGIIRWQICLMPGH